MVRGVPQAVEKEVAQPRCPYCGEERERQVEVEGYKGFCNTAESSPYPSSTRR